MAAIDSLVRVIGLAAGQRMFTSLLVTKMQ